MDRFLILAQVSETTLGLKNEWWMAIAVIIGFMVFIAIAFTKFYQKPGPEEAIVKTGLGGLAAPHLANSSELLRPAAISPCTITMDHNAIICFMTE